jgi:carbon-monoxide dehydrogenase large subunit
MRRTQPPHSCSFLKLPSGTTAANGRDGTTPALAAVINAVVDALAELGVRHIEMPATPERVWRAVREGAARTK